MRKFVSITTDRSQDGGGYRLLVAVLGNPTHRQQLLADAMAELKTFERKYQVLEELATVFAAIRKTRRDLGDKTE